MALGHWEDSVRRAQERNAEANECRQARELIRRLLDWEKFMGGFGASVWEDARNFLDK